jgi:hypothetical protein
VIWYQIYVNGIEGRSERCFVGSAKGKGGGFGRRGGADFGEWLVNFDGAWGTMFRYLNVFFVRFDGFRNRSESFAIRVIWFRRWGVIGREVFVLLSLPKGHHYWKDSFLELSIGHQEVEKGKSFSTVSL